LNSKYCTVCVSKEMNHYFEFVGLESVNLTFLVQLTYGKSI